MIPAQTIRKLFEYYFWACEQQLAACEALTGEQFTRDLGNSFASVRDTFHHLLVAEWYWNHRWRNSTIGEVPDPKGVPTVAALRERWQPIAAETREFLGGLDDERMADVISFINMQRKQTTCSLWEAFFHFLNHQSYHRGQITTLLRQLGAKAPSVDYATRYLQEVRPQA